MLLQFFSVAYFLNHPYDLQTSKCISKNKSYKQHHTIYSMLKPLSKPFAYLSKVSVC